MLQLVTARASRLVPFFAVLATVLVLAACGDREWKNARPVLPEATTAAAPEQAADAPRPGGTPEPAAAPEPSAVPLAAKPALPSVGPVEAGRLVGQAYRELAGRLFREISPADLLGAGWRGLRDEARRQGLAGLDTLGPFTEAGSRDIDSFQREFILFVTGPGAALDAGKLSQAAIRGMTASVGDSHTRYVSPQVSELDTEGDGTYTGIGVVTRTETLGPVITRVYENSPAAQAGLRAGDRIIKVDGNEVGGREQAEISRQIRGMAGTTVTLTVTDADGASREVPVYRARISPPVIGARMLTETIGYLSVAHFPRRSAFTDAAAEFEQALVKLQATGAKAFVLDLRGNPGGDPTTSVDIASNFTQDGPIFVAVNRNGRRTVYQPNKNRQLVAAPLVVLTDGASASGAEVVASALAEYGQGYLIGGRTCGCLSVGQPLKLDDKSQIVVTVQQALTGRFERSLEGAGLEPHEYVRASRTAGQDAPLERAVDYLAGRLK